jgi:hypothetical protein
MIKTIIEDGFKGTSSGVAVDKNGAMAVASITPPLPDV